MSINRALYEQVILEHNKNPRNFRKMPDADHAVEGHNPLCGDHFTVYLRMEDERIADVSFYGAGCAISKSSASIMTTILKGKTRKDAEEMFERFHRMITSEPDSEISGDSLGKLEVFSGVRRFPIRIKCATLPWHAMVSALEGAGKVISTE